VILVAAVFFAHPLNTSIKARSSMVNETIRFIIVFLFMFFVFPSCYWDFTPPMWMTLRGVTEVHCVSRSRSSPYSSG
jgi:hypothetical protein